MGNELRLTITDRDDALILIDQIISDFNSTTKKQADHGRGGAIGWAGRSVFGALAKTPGAFVLPVPFDRQEVSIQAGYSDGTVAKAMKSLVGQGLVTMSGSRSSRMVQLHLPSHVVAAYRQHAARSAAVLGDPFDDEEVERALALLGKTDPDKPVVPGLLTTDSHRRQGMAR